MRKPLKDRHGVPYPAEVQALLELYQISPGTYGEQALITALESVRGQQADVSMTDPENILFFEGRSVALMDLRHMLRISQGQSVRVCIDAGALKVKVGDHSWSPGMRSERPNGGYAKVEEGR